MTKRSNNGREPPPVALEKIIACFHRVARPVYLGALALEVGYGLNQTHAMLETLHESGLVRPLTEAEKRSLDIDPRGYVWTLVGKADPGLACW